MSQGFYSVLVFLWSYDRLPPEEPHPDPFFGGSHSLNNDGPGYVLSPLLNVRLQFGPG